MEDFEQQPTEPKQNDNTKINEDIWKPEHSQKNNPITKSEEGQKNDLKIKPPTEEAEPRSEGQSSTGGAPEVKEPENPERLPDAEHAF
ncbi:hypothetical protein KA183_11035 [bacterium]|nr:hypothetical protein [bacterium]